MTRPTHYRREDPASQPAMPHPAYGSTVARSPTRSPIPLQHTLSETTGPVYGHRVFGSLDHDLTAQHATAPIGERIILWGRVLDEDERPQPRTLVEIWQANAAGRYAHAGDQHDAPLDPNFTGAGRVLTDDDGCYRFVTIRPGAYPWRNHYDAWRPAHVHFSLLGPCFVTRLVTQMYFPGDPLLAFDPIFNSVPGERARERLIARYSPDRDIPEHALAYRFDIVLRGPAETPAET